MNNIINELEESGFLKIKNADELASVVAVLELEGYSLVGTSLSTFNPFARGRKKCIYLMKGWNEELRRKYKKWLWWADILRKDDVSNLFPYGTPDSL